MTTFSLSWLDLTQLWADVATMHAFCSHGLRTGIFEATKLVLINVAPNLPEIQVLSIVNCIRFLFYLSFHSDLQ